MSERLRPSSVDPTLSARYAADILYFALTVDQADQWTAEVWLIERRDG